MKTSYLNKTAILLLMLIGAAGCGNPPASDTEPAPMQLTVATAPVTRADMVEMITIFGTIQLRQEAHLGSQFDGRLSDFSLLPGDAVKKGERIGTIIPPAREALLQVLDSMPAGTRPALEKQIQTIPLVSPINGVVLDVMHHTGDVLQKGDAIVHIGDLRMLDVRGDLPIRYLPDIRQTKTVSVSFLDFPHPPLDLQLEAISGKINESNQTAMIRLKLNNPDGLYRPGMLAKLTFSSAQHTSTMVMPRNALLEEEGVFSAFVLNGNHVVKHEVEVGIMQDDRVEILSGLQENDLVVTEKAYSLEDGLEVRVK